MTDAPRLRIGATNVTGLGAVQLAQSLLPAFERLGRAAIEKVYLPDRGPLAAWRPLSAATSVATYRRLLPHVVSRVFECTMARRFYAGTTPLLTLGDMPVPSAARQIVLVQSPHLTSAGSQLAKYRLSRALFRVNLRFADAVIVQTGSMREAFLATYAIDPDRVHVIAQPPPEWLAAARLQRTGRVHGEPNLSLFYPAADYPHKNHQLLAKVAPPEAWNRLVDKLVLTVAPSANPNPGLRFLRCVGRLSSAEVIAAYAQSDALLFLSQSESYGFPLVEAMTIGLPIVCPDLPYARDLCGPGAIYFSPDDADSLKAALAELQGRLRAGWWPHWTAQLQVIPQNWDIVAEQMADLL